MKKQTIQYANYFYKILIYLVKLFSPIILHDLKIYFPKNQKNLSVPYPTVLYANHVIELDVAALGSVFQFVEPKIRFTFPMRQDISEKNFLTKEFQLKGLLGFILKIIDKTNFIPRVLNFLGGIPIKRPFRDDARELIKSGQMEKIIDDQWKILANNLTSGNNLFLFPEGKFGYTGNLDPIRKGIWILGNQIQNLNFNSVTLTYDFLSHKKPILHISVGENKKIDIAWEEKEIAKYIKHELGSHFVITPANLFSFYILQLKHSEERDKKDLVIKIIQIAEAIRTEGKLKISPDFFVKGIESQIEKLLDDSIQKDFLIVSQDKIQTTEKLHRTEFPNPASIRKLNPYFYHANQLHFYRDEIQRLITGSSRT